MPQQAVRLASSGDDLRTLSTSDSSQRVAPHQYSTTTGKKSCRQISFVSVFVRRFPAKRQFDNLEKLRSIIRFCFCLLHAVLLSMSIAQDEDETRSFRTGRDMVECLENMSHDIQATIKEEMALDSQRSRDKIVTKLESLQHAVASNSKALAFEIKVLRDEIALQTKHQRLDFACNNAGLGHFYYRIKHDGSSDYTASNGLVIEIIGSFRGGFGHCIHGFVGYTPEATALFHTNLSDQFLKLTGVKPRIEQDESSGKYMIYYS